MMRIPIFSVMMFLWMCLVLGRLVHAETKLPAPPNIIYILADDMGLGDISCLNSNSAWKTPHLDQLAREGRIFTDAHSASGVCTPSRYALLTGRYSWRGAMKSSVLHGYDPSLIEKGRLTVPALLRSHGYATAMVGKWHLGLDWVRGGSKLEDVDYTKPFQGGPVARGFDTFFGISASLDMPPYVYLENDRARSVPTERVADSPKPKMWRAGPIAPDFKHQEVQPLLFQKSREFLTTRSQAKDGKPFFLYLALASPHTPIVPTKGFEGKTRTTPYGDFIAELDAEIGVLLADLDRLDFAKNTLVIFTADNGFAPAANLEELRKLNHEPSLIYRGHKADLFEGGHRVPFIARWPGTIPAGTRCNETIGHLDLIATCAEILGVRLPDAAGEDSVSILSVLRGGDSLSPQRSALVHHSNNGSFALRQGRWKLFLVPDSGGWSSPKPGQAAGLPRFQLYDLTADPSEKRNLQAEHPQRVQQMGLLLRELIEKGRTTAGSPQGTELTVPWPQVGWMKEFVQ